MINQISYRRKPLSIDKMSRYIFSHESIFVFSSSHYVLKTSTMTEVMSQQNTLSKQNSELHEGNHWELHFKTVYDHKSTIA